MTRQLSADELPDLDQALRVEEHFVGTMSLSLDLSSQVPLKADDKGLKWKDIDIKAKAFCPDSGNSIFD